MNKIAPLKEQTALDVSSYAPLPKKWSLYQYNQNNNPLNRALYNRLVSSLKNENYEQCLQNEIHPTKWNEPENQPRINQIKNYQQKLGEKIQHDELLGVVETQFLYMLKNYAKGYQQFAQSASQQNSDLSHLQCNNLVEVNAFLQTQFNWHDFLQLWRNAKNHCEITVLEKKQIPDYLKTTQLRFNSPELFKKEVLKLSDVQFLQALLWAKSPVSCAELDTKDMFKYDEFKALGDIIVLLEDVKILGPLYFAEGVSRAMKNARSYTQEQQFKAHLAFMPGVLNRGFGPNIDVISRKDQTGYTDEHGTKDVYQKNYCQVYCHRAFVNLKIIDTKCPEGKMIFHVIPNIGGDNFAVTYQGIATARFSDHALKCILRDHHQQFLNTKVVFLKHEMIPVNQEPYLEYSKFGHIDYFFGSAAIGNFREPAAYNELFAQYLSKKDLEELNSYSYLTKWVAANHGSMPGNEANGGEVTMSDAAASFYQCDGVRNITKQPMPKWFNALKNCKKLKLNIDEANLHIINVPDINYVNSTEHSFAESQHLNTDDMPMIAENHNL